MMTYYVASDRNIAEEHLPMNSHIATATIADIEYPIQFELASPLTREQLKELLAFVQHHMERFPTCHVQIAHVEVDAEGNTTIPHKNALALNRIVSPEQLNLQVGQSLKIRKGML